MKGSAMKTLTQITLLTALLALPFHAMAENEKFEASKVGPKSYESYESYEFCEKCKTYRIDGSYDKNKAISEKEAKQKFETFLSKQLKGFTITKMETARMPMGTMYWIIIEDKNGNEMELYMNPGGYIRGPFIR
jgi:hypothetical protein